MAKEFGHRRFAAVWAWMTAHEGRQQREARRRVMAGIEGRVLEIGFGVGSNWAHLPGTVHQYVGIEPDRYMLERATATKGRDAVEGRLVRARGQELPFANDSFDAVFTTLTFCTIEDVPGALAEIRRVLRPGGVFRFWEHVRPEGRVSGRVTDVLAPAWRKVGGGCNPNRRTVQAIEAAGFRITSLHTPNRSPLPMVFGTATADGAGSVPILERAARGVRD